MSALRRTLTIQGRSNVARRRGVVLAARAMSTAPATEKVKGPPKRVTTQLKDLLDSKSLEFLMEAHNGISAKIVEETGFQAIWASGLSVSAALGCRDSNEASWTQVLEQIEFMTDSVNIPILLDGDTGYGNFNNARRLIAKLESRGVAGVCLEDKLFPKTNSFIDGELQPLADINEFCGKIMACKDTQVCRPVTRGLRSVRGVQASQTG
jgi:2-methylisocitrate lyase-like PEP mutase family enzyme